MCNFITKSGQKCKNSPNFDVCAIHKFKEKKPRECPICMDPLFQTKKRLECGHWMHSTCLQRYIIGLQDIKRQHGKPLLTVPECPICKTPLNNVSLPDFNITLTLSSDDMNYIVVMCLNHKNNILETVIGHLLVHMYENTENFNISGEMYASYFYKNLFSLTLYFSDFISVMLEHPKIYQFYGYSSSILFKRMFPERKVESIIQLHEKFYDLITSFDGEIFIEI